MSLTELEPGLEEWMINSARSLRSKAEEIRVFEKEDIYIEYWIQNELAYCLPWSEGGMFLVDQGQGLAVSGSEKYPDFLLCFPHSPRVYFFELKDLLTKRNLARNRRALAETTEFMASNASRSETIARWKRARLPKFLEFGGQMENRGFAFGGIGFGSSHVNEENLKLSIPAKQWHWNVGNDWIITLLLAENVMSN